MSDSGYTSEFAVPFPQVIKRTQIEEPPVTFKQENAATPISPDSEESAKDELGYTNPNLHRRIQDAEYRDRGHSAEINPSQQEIDEYNLVLANMAPNDYALEIHQVDSYRTTTVYLHDDDLDGGPGSGETEIP